MLCVFPLSSTVRRLTAVGSCSGLVALVRFISVAVVSSEFASGGNELDHRRYTSRASPVGSFKCPVCCEGSSIRLDQRLLAIIEITELQTTINDGDGHALHPA